MSIPKQPRQLMINIMYLVLTALLALNVSAEIFNAFKMVNHGLKESNIALDRTNSSLPASIERRAKSKPEFQKYAERAPLAAQYDAEFSAYVRGVFDNLVDKSGNKNGFIDDGDYNHKKTGKDIKGLMDKDVTTRYMVKEGVGLELKNKIQEYNCKFLSLVDENNRVSIEKELPLKIDDETWKKSSKKSWEDFTFRQMPLGACEPIFTKFINDAKASENVILNYLSNKLSGEDPIFDDFSVISSPKKNYIIKGEPFETFISLAASSSKESGTKVNLSVNGVPLEVDEHGLALWKTNGTELGVKKYTAVANVINPVNGKVKSYRRDFEFEVGERSCSVSASKMNVFYIGVDNPVDISASGVPSPQLKVEGAGSGLNLKSLGSGSYIATVSQPGICTITLSGGGLNATEFKFRAKRIPTPQPALGEKKGGYIQSGSFKAYPGITTIIEGFEFPNTCQITQFRCVRIPNHQDPQVKFNSGSNLFNQDVKSVIAQAKSGDRYIFEDIKARCPGDISLRELNDLAFSIR